MNDTLFIKCQNAEFVICINYDLPQIYFVYEKNTFFEIGFCHAYDFYFPPMW